MKSFNKHYVKSESTLLDFLKEYNDCYGKIKTINTIQRILRKKYVNKVLSDSETISKDKFGVIISNGKAIDYEFLLLSYLKSYKFYNSKEKTINLMEDIIRMSDEVLLSKDLEEIGIDRLSIVLSNMVLEHLKNENNKVDLTCLVPAIMENHIHLISKRQKKRNKKVRKSSKIKRMFTTTALMVLCASSTVSSLNKLKSAEKSQEIIKVEDNLEDELCILPENTDIQKKITIHDEEIQDANAILSHFKKCNTIKDILKRQQELESLDLTDDYKVYKDCKLPVALQRFIYEQSIVNGYPVDFTFSIIHAETRGEFNSSGKASYNAINNYDLGLTQQNNIYSVKSFSDFYNIDYDKACELVQYNDYVNVMSAFRKYQEIAANQEEFNPIEFAGCYNGWLNWDEKPISREYVDLFKDVYNNVYTEHHDIETKKTKIKK